MKFRILILTAVAALMNLSFIQNGADDQTVKQMSGTYVGVSQTDFQYSPKPIVQKEEQIVLKQSVKDGNRFDIVFRSKFGALYTATEVGYSIRDGKVLLSTPGKAQMTGMDGSTQEHDFYMKAEIALDKSSYRFEFSIPKVMGGIKTVLKK